VQFCPNEGLAVHTLKVGSSDTTRHCPIAHCDVSVHRMREDEIRHLPFIRLVPGQQRALFEMAEPAATQPADALVRSAAFDNGEDAQSPCLSHTLDLSVTWLPVCVQLFSQLNVLDWDQGVASMLFTYHLYCIFRADAPVWPPESLTDGGQFPMQVNDDVLALEAEVEAMAMMAGAGGVDGALFATQTPSLLHVRFRPVAQSESAAQIFPFKGRESTQALVARLHMPVSLFARGQHSWLAAHCVELPTGMQRPQ